MPPKRKPVLSPPRPAYYEVDKAKRDQKQRYGAVDASTVVAAAPRARQRAFRLTQKDAVEETVQAADIESQLNLAKWVDRDIPLKTLKDVIDPKSADEFALLAAALRSGTPLTMLRERSRGPAGLRAEKAGAAGAARGQRRQGGAPPVNGAGNVTVLR